VDNFLCSVGVMLFELFEYNCDVVMCVD